MSDLQNLPLASWLALFHIPGLGVQGIRRLLGMFGQPAEVLGANESDWRRAGINDTVVLEGLRNPAWQTVEQDLQWAESSQHHILTWQDPDYPRLLQEISDPPPILFVVGDPQVLAMPQLAMVGSRNASRGSEETAFNFARDLSQRGLVITSGLALGIDAASHRGALAGGGVTIAVVGTGVDRVYPAKHKTLAHEIVDQGAMVSELPLGSQPSKASFPRRNRIISGLSLGTLVVEAAQHSGSLITARQAMEQGREVFAIPGSIHNPMAKGCHRLIREGAKLVETSRDIIEELSSLLDFSLAEQADINDAEQQQDDFALDESYQALLQHIGFEPTPMDIMVERSGLTPEAVSSMLLVLELHGYVASASGGQYLRSK